MWWASTHHPLNPMPCHAAAVSSGLSGAGPNKLQEAACVPSCRQNEGSHSPLVHASELTYGSHYSLKLENDTDPSQPGHQPTARSSLGTVAWQSWDSSIGKSEVESKHAGAAQSAWAWSPEGPHKTQPLLAQGNTCHSCSSSQLPTKKGKVEREAADRPRPEKASY